MLKCQSQRDLTVGRFFDRLEQVPGETSRDGVPCYLVATFAFAVLLVGCQRESQPPVVAPAIVSAPAVEAPPAADEAQSTTTEPVAADESELSEVATLEEKYVPPFPDRVDLFTPATKSQAAVRRSGDSDDEGIELRGFARVKEPHAILAINGIISPVAVGQEVYGVRVIAINEPEVELQRGRNRWTESLH